jgi:rSAM/selenodomain-associated transferase 2
MRCAFIHAFGHGEGSAALIGTDCPGITAALLRKAFAALKVSDCVLGPAHDGGYYLMALKRDQPELFSSIPWGTHMVMEKTLQVIRKSGLKVTLLAPLADVDRPEDLHVWEEERGVRTGPMISVVIPVLNEEAVIERAIEKAFGGRNVEVILVDGGSTDRSTERAALMGARVLDAPPGRASQMNRGAGAALGDILLFLHADTVPCEGYDNAVRLMLADPDIAMGAFSLGFDRGSFPLELIAFGANLRSRIFKLPYGDQAFFVRKSVFMSAGGFQDIPIMEDVAFVNAMKKKGRIGILKNRVTTSSRRFTAMGPLRTWVLNQLALAGFVLGMPLAELAGLYRGRERSPGIWIQHVLKARKNTLCR